VGVALVLVNCFWAGAILILNWAVLTAAFLQGKNSETGMLPECFWLVLKPGVARYLKCEAIHGYVMGESVLARLRLSEQ
jgi:hypothetical protein